MSILKNILKRLGVNTDSNNFADIKQEHDYSPSSYQTDEEHKENNPIPNDGTGVAIATEETEEGKQVYITLDGDDVGGEVEEGLVSDEVEPAKQLSAAIRKSHEMIKAEFEKYGGQVIFDGGDNLMGMAPFSDELIESIQKIYKDLTDHTVTIGVGDRPRQAHFALVYGKNTGKNRVVVYDQHVEEEVKKIKEEQKKLEDTYKKLKYKAGSKNSKEQIKQWIQDKLIDGAADTAAVISSFSEVASAMGATWEEFMEVMDGLFDSGEIAEDENGNLLRVACVKTTDPAEGDRTKMASIKTTFKDLKTVGLTKGGTFIVSAATNEQVIEMFCHDSFPKDKHENWGTENLQIMKAGNGWALVNYGTPLVYRDSGGKTYLNADRYSVSTSKIQNLIRQYLANAEETDEMGIASAIEGDYSQDKKTDEWMESMKVEHEKPGHEETKDCPWCDKTKASIVEAGKNIGDLTPEEIDWASSILSNDENSTDEEMTRYFVENGLDQEAAAFLVSKRDLFLRREMDSPSDLEQSINERQASASLHKNTIITGIYDSLANKYRLKIGDSPTHAFYSHDSACDRLARHIGHVDATSFLESLKGAMDRKLDRVFKVAEPQGTTEYEQESQYRSQQGRPMGPQQLDATSDEEKSEKNFKQWDRVCLRKDPEITGTFVKIQDTKPGDIDLIVVFDKPQANGHRLIEVVPTEINHLGERSSKEQIADAQAEFDRYSKDINQYEDEFDQKIEDAVEKQADTVVHIDEMQVTDDGTVKIKELPEVPEDAELKVKRSGWLKSSKLPPKKEKELDDIVQQAVYGYQINIMDISKVYAVAEAAYVAGKSPEEITEAVHGLLNQIAIKTSGAQDNLGLCPTCQKTICVCVQAPAGDHANPLVPSAFVEAPVKTECATCQKEPCICDVIMQDDHRVDVWKHKLVGSDKKEADLPAMPHLGDDEYPIQCPDDGTVINPDEVVDGSYECPKCHNFWNVKSESDAEPEGPSESDIVIQDARGGGYEAVCDGKVIATGSDWEGIHGEVVEWSQNHNWKPTVWLLSDHGNYHLVTDWTWEYKKLGDMNPPKPEDSSLTPGNKWVMRKKDDGTTSWEQVPSTTPSTETVDSTVTI